MLTRDLPLHVLALLVYPGLVLVLAVGAVAEVGTAFALAGGGLRAALLAPTAWPRSNRHVPICARRTASCRTRSIVFASRSTTCDGPSARDHSLPRPLQSGRGTIARPPRIQNARIS